MSQKELTSFTNQAQMKMRKNFYNVNEEKHDAPKTEEKWFALKGLSEHRAGTIYMLVSRSNQAKRLYFNFRGNDLRFI